MPNALKAQPLKGRPLRDLGQAFRIAREEAGWSQKELAKRARMYPAQMSRLEGGYDIKAQFYVRVARALDFDTVTALLHHVEDPASRQMRRLLAMLTVDTRATAVRHLADWLVERAAPPKPAKRRR